MILITGASGFIGNRLLYRVVNEFGREKVLALTSKPINICPYLLHNDYNFESDFFIKNGYQEINTIIHAGAFTPKSSNEGNDYRLCNTNITNTAKLLSAQLPYLKKIIFLSTLDVYANSPIIDESSPVSPVSLYGHSKIYCEEMIKSWCKENEISNITLRIGHVYGPGEEKYKKIIPVMMRQIIDGKPLTLFGEGDEIRTFIYVDDVIDAISNTLRLNVKNELINIVGSEQITIRDLMKMIISISKRKIIIEKVERASKPRNLIFNNKRMCDLLHIPKISLSDGLNYEWDYMQKI